MSDYETLLKNLKKAKSEFQAAGKSIIKATIDRAFAKNPQLKVIVWCQYTPYFNDGEACEFGINDVFFSNAEDPENLIYGGEDYDGEQEDVWIFNASDIENAVKQNLVNDAEPLIQIDDIIHNDEMTDIMQQVFGDHVQVIATRDGIETQEYEHD